MRNSKKYVHNPTRPLKKQQPKDIWLIFYYFVQLIQIIELIRTFIWLLRHLNRVVSKLYHAMMSFLDFEIMHYIIEKPHAGFIVKTVGFYGPMCEKPTVLHTRIWVSSKLTTLPETPRKKIARPLIHAHSMPIV